MGFFNFDTLLNAPYKKLNRIFLFSLVFLALLSPPYLIIFIFFRELFHQLNFINLLFLSIFSYAPFFLFNFYSTYYVAKVYIQINTEEDFEEVKFKMMDNILMVGASQNLKAFYLSLFFTAIRENINITYFIKSYLDFQLILLSFMFIYPHLLFLKRFIDNNKIYFITKLFIYGVGVWIIINFGSPMIGELVDKIIY